MKHYCVLGNKRGDLICCWSQKTCKHLIIQHSEEKTDIFNIVHIVCEVVHRFFHDGIFKALYQTYIFCSFACGRAFFTPKTKGANLLYTKRQQIGSSFLLFHN